MSGNNETVDVREVRQALRRGWRWIAAAAVGGAVAASMLTTAIRPVYKGRTTLLLRSGAAAPGLAMSRDGISPLGLASALVGGSSAFDTELELLGSRSVLGEVADSLFLQAEVVEPTGIPATAVFARAAFPRQVRDGTYSFSRSGNAWRVKGPDGRAFDAAPGAPFDLGGGQVALRADAPAAFRVRLADLDRTVDRMLKDMDAKRAAGDVAEIKFSAHDAATAAAVPNAVISRYLARRRTTDRGSNQSRYEFLLRHTDSISAALADAEGRLRSYQESSGTVDPGFVASREVEQAIKLRGDLEELRTESRGLGAVLKTGVSSDAVAAYPSLLRNQGINAVLTRLIDLQARRTDLGARRTDRDPEVATLDTSIAHTQAELTSLAREYYGGLTRQEAEIEQQLGGYKQTLATVPRDVQETARLQREVRRLSETLVALQTQLLQTRLAAMGEGGDVHQVDVAMPPLAPSFPVPLLNLVLGTFGGLFLGTIGVLVGGQTRRRVFSTLEAELATGLPAAELHPGAPLLLAGADGWRTLLVLPAHQGADASAVGAALARTAALRGETVVLVDPARAWDAPSTAIGPGATTTAPVPVDGPLGSALVPVGGAGGDGFVAWDAGGSAAPAALRSGLAELEARFGRVLVVLPEADGFAAVAVMAEGRSAVVCGRSGRARRDELERAARAARRMGVDVVGVVLEGPKRRRQDLA